MILTVSEAERDLLDAVAAGAAGYLLKTASTEEVRDALVAAAAGEPVFSPVAGGPRARRVPPAVAAPPTASPLTDVSAPSCNSWPAATGTPRSPASCPSRPKTAENHVRNILGKLHLSRRTDLVRYAVRHGFE